MKKSPPYVVLIAGFALLAGSLPARAQPAEPAKTRKIVRIISADDDSTVEVEHRKEIVLAGMGGDAESLLVTGFARKRGYLGVQMIDLTRELRSHFGAPDDAGVMVSKVLEGSPAEGAGLRPGDILLALDGEPLSSAIGLERKIAPLDDQTGVTLEILRAGARRSLPVTIAERERPSIDLGRLALASPGEIHGFEWVGPGDIEKHVIRIDPQGLEDALRELEVRIEKPDFAERFGELGQSRLDMQRRIRELEERLQSLERQLEEFSND